MASKKVHKLAIIIKNGDYEERRKLDGQSGFVDLTDEVNKDGARVKKSLKEFSFSAGDIREHSDCSYQDLSEIVQGLKTTIDEHELCKERLTVFFYYAGHGTMKNYTYAAPVDS